MASSEEPDPTHHNMDETAPRTLHGLKVLGNLPYLTMSYMQCVAKLT